jgi:hypothetical protein
LEEVELVAMGEGKEVTKGQRVKAYIWLTEPSFASNSSATERDEWLEAISRSIEEYAKKKITFCHSRSLDEVLSFPTFFFQCISKSFFFFFNSKEPFHRGLEKQHVSMKDWRMHVSNFRVKCFSIY